MDCCNRECSYFFIAGSVDIFYYTCDACSTVQFDFGKDNEDADARRLSAVRLE